MGERPERQAASKAADLPEEISEIIAAFHRVVQEDAPYEEQGKVCEVERKAQRLLQPLWHTGQLRETVRLLPPSEEDTFQVDESTKPEKELYLEGLRQVIQPLQSTQPTAPGQKTSKDPWHIDSVCLRRKRVRLRSPVRENCTPGSVRGASGDRCPYRDPIIVDRFG